jgi:hypothetical protein
MSDDKRDVLEVLKFELAFLEQGGYGRSVRTPWKPTSVFVDSPSCLNFNDASEQRHPCHECLLTDFVPAGAQGEAVPCHHIPVGPKGETLDDLESNRITTEYALRDWLRATIERMEKQRTAAPEKTA